MDSLVDERFMAEALREAELGLHDGNVPIGAVVVRSGAILARAHWSWEQQHDLLAHPELVALGNSTDLRGGTLYTTLEPCVMCMGAAMSRFLERVVYALDAPTDGAAGIPALYAERLPEVGRPWSIPAVMRGVGMQASMSLIERFLRTAGPGPMKDWAASLIETRRANHPRARSRGAASP